MNAKLKTLLDRVLPLPTHRPKAELAREALAAMERLYLRANGWTYIGDDWWKPPERYVFTHHKRPVPHRHGHAVNSQKLADSYK